MWTNGENGFTLMEVIVAGLIFSIATVGIFSALTSIRQPTAIIDQSVSMAYCGQQVLETFRARVDARDWNSGGLTVGNHTISGAALAAYPICSSAGVTSVTYVVSDAGNGARKVVATVNW